MARLTTPCCMRGRWIFIAAPSPPDVCCETRRTPRTEAQRPHRLLLRSMLSPPWQRSGNRLSILATMEDFGDLRMVSTSRRFPALLMMRPIFKISMAALDRLRRWLALRSIRRMRARCWWGWVRTGRLPVRPVPLQLRGGNSLLVKAVLWRSTRPIHCYGMSRLRPGSAFVSGAPTVGPAQVANDDSLIDAPWLLDPALSSDVLIGTCRVWRGSAGNGASWSSANSISKHLGGPQNASCASTNPVIRSLAAGGPASNAAATQNAGSEVLYAGMAGALDGGGNFGGHVFSITTANTASSSTAWTDLATSPVTNGQGTGFNAGGFDVSSVAADPHDATGKTIYVTVMG